MAKQEPTALQLVERMEQQAKKDAAEVRKLRNISPIHYQLDAAKHWQWTSEDRASAVRGTYEKMRKELVSDG